MNTASENLEHRLGILQQKLQHATDYDSALGYFLEEFAGNATFIRRCQPEEAPHLLTVVGHVAEKALGKPAEFEQSRAFRLPFLGFCHGKAAVSGRVVLFFYFEALNTGLMALIPGVNGPTEVARFRLPGVLAGNPSLN